MGRKNPKIEWLSTYLGLKCQVDNREDRIKELENACHMPAMPESDGSKRTPGASDRMANATLRFMEYRDKVAPVIRSYRAEMQAIEDAINAIWDPLQREVLIQRYIEGQEGYRLMKWRNVALKIYHNDDDADIDRVSRLHGAALLSLEMEEKPDEENDL